MFYYGYFFTTAEPENFQIFWYLFDVAVLIPIT